MTPPNSWARRMATLHGELAALTEVNDPRWWLLAGGAAAAEPWAPRIGYVASDAEPGADTFIGQRAPAPAIADLARDAIARAHAARAALRELDGALPDQPLAVTIRRGPAGAAIEPSALDCAAFAIGDRCWWAPLAVAPDVEHELARDLNAALASLAGGAAIAPTRLRAPGHGPTPFVTIALGSEPIATARHGHRRGWASGDSGERGPWLGLGRTDDGVAVVSTCHLAVDGYGHAWLSARIVDQLARLRAQTAALPASPTATPVPAPALAAVVGAISLGIAWRALPMPAPRALPLAYALGGWLHGVAGVPRARFSPTLQIPIAPGDRADPLRLRRRPVAAIASVRFEHGAPEPFAAFDARTREVLAREADGRGLCSRLLAAARAAPAPTAWKRRAVSAAGRPRWLDRVAAVVGGRACLSRIGVTDAALPPSCAVSSPARMASATDPLGACVVTVIDDGAHAAITVCGSGLAGTAADADAVIDALLARL